MNFKTCNSMDIALIQGLACINSSHIMISWNCVFSTNLCYPNQRENGDKWWVRPSNRKWGSLDLRLVNLN